MFTQVTVHKLHFKTERTKWLLGGRGGAALDPCSVLFCVQPRSLRVTRCSFAGADAVQQLSSKPAQHGLLIPHISAAHGDSHQSQ